jgi:hypothetical protein
VKTVGLALAAAGFLPTGGVIAFKKDKTIRIALMLSY